MHIRARILTISLFTLFISFSSFTQVSQDNIYSRFGLGDIVTTGSGTERGMGGAGIAVRTRGVINLQNPAGLNAIDTLSFILDIGMQGQHTSLKTSTQSLSYNDMNAGHIAIGFALARWWKTGVSLTPYSLLGYSIKDTTTIQGNNNLVNNFYSGSGGTNALTISNGIKIYKNIYAGFNIVYLFGNLQNTEYNDFNINVQTNSYYSSTTYQTNAIIGGFYGNLGLQFSDTIAKKFVFSLGATYGPAAKVKARLDEYVRNELVVSSITRSDTIYNVEGSNSNVQIPKQFGIGMAISHEKFTFALDYVQQNWSSTSMLGVNSSLVNLKSFRGGLEIVPKYNSFTSYLARVRYRMGGHYTNTYLQLNGHQLNDYGFSVGLGFPFRNSPAILNIAFEAGRRGTTIDNLTMENYSRIYMNIALGDIWFLKRKFE